MESRRLLAAGAAAWNDSDLTRAAHVSLRADGGGDLAANPTALSRTHRGIASAASTCRWNLG
jgi:hypothetical protein